MVVDRCVLLLQRARCLHFAAVWSHVGEGI